MKNKLPYTFLFATSLVGASVVACVDTSSQPGGEDATQVSDELAQSNGGFTTADEAADFGVAGEFAAAAIEADSGDPGDAMATDPSVAAVQQAANAEVRDVVVMWGHIPHGPGGIARDWTGSWTLSRGALIVRRTIAFEPRTDHLNFPRTSPQTVSFTSVTKPASDGLALSIIDNSGDATPLTLTYAPADPTITPTTYQIDVTALDAGPVVIDAGNGDKIVAVGDKPATTSCDGGFMRGRFHALGAASAANGGVGVYVGVVTDRVGLPVGAVRGIYGDHKVYGKFIDLQGHFIGLINGEYDATNDFQAKWMVAGDATGALTEHGRLHGHYFESTAVDGGHFQARWAASACSQDGGGGGGGGGGSGSGGPGTGTGTGSN
jgi:hypothetical protein|nr:hypothetical protein [Kofleriaceae bacterium]